MTAQFKCLRYHSVTFLTGGIMSCSASVTVSHEAEVILSTMKPEGSLGKKKCSVQLQDPDLQTPEFTIICSSTLMNPNTGLLPSPLLASFLFLPLPSLLPHIPLTPTPPHPYPPLSHVKATLIIIVS